jgi:hypothetical protein
MALTVGVKTVLDSREVVVVITGQRQVLVLSMSIEHGMNHLWTLLMLQTDSWELTVVDEDTMAGTYRRGGPCLARGSLLIAAFRASHENSQVHDCTSN